MIMSPIMLSSSLSLRAPPTSRTRVSCSSPRASMDTPAEKLRAKFMEFPYASTQQMALMVELLSSVETRLGPSLQPCTLPPDVQYFENPTASAHGSLQVRSGTPSSQVDFILGGWFHCNLPSGGAVSITSLSAYLKASTDAPHFLLDLIQSSPTSLVLILDLIPRKDLILYSEYLKTYYEDSQVDKHKRNLEALPGATPYCSPFLYARAVVSPTAAMVNIDTGDSGTTDAAEILRDHVGPAVKEMLRFWMDTCACLEKKGVAEDNEKAYLEKRDGIIKKKTIDVELGSSLPKLFGEEVADGVLSVLKKYFYA